MAKRFVKITPVIRQPSENAIVAIQFEKSEE
jgi:hypothetical protein